MNHRVVITGIGLCTPVGSGLEEFWRRLCAGQSGIGPITLFDASALTVRIGGEVKTLDVESLAARFPAAAGERDRKIWLGLDAASQAIADAGLLPGDSAFRVPRSPLSEAALFVGVSLEALFLEQITPAVLAGGESGAFTRQILTLSEGRPLQTPLDRLADVLGDTYGLRGGRVTNCSACAAGAQAIGEGFRRVRDGSAELVLAGATDSSLNPLGLGGFSLLHILSTENEQPARACRPFDATRQGTVLAEGAAFVVLETRQHAAERGARVYAEVLGYGSSLDAYRVTDPEPTGRGAVLSMTRALRDAGLRPKEIDAVNAHGTGTLKNDVAETLAIKQVLGPRARAIPVTANKSMTGHLIAASGAVEAVASTLTLFTSKVPPTINRQHPDPECDLDYVTEGCRDFAGRTVLSNSFGFGGQNATLIFGRFES
jgi:3-oxoacyl-[acyl-carrier-protein] synthase II